MLPLSVSILLSIPLVSGWSEEGHAIITNVAIRLISDQSSRYLENLLGDDLLTASVWADSEDASTRYPESHEYHFSHTPYRDCQPFDIDRDCGFPGKEGLCIVTGLADAIEMATDPYVPRESRLDAMKFVLHFMGDIHQPLHTGFRKDFGGNAIGIGNMPGKTLHELWDFDLVRRRMGSGGIEAFTDLVLASVRSNSGAFIKRVKEQVDVLSIVRDGITDGLVSYTASMATDTIMTSTCKMAYMKNATSYINDGDVVSDEYLNQRGVSVQVQLSKAAVRLSVLLEAMAGVYAERRAVKREAAREVRMQKLFETREKAAEILANKVPNPLQGNRYAILAMEFDPIKLQWVMKPEEVDVVDDVVAVAEENSGTASLTMSPMRKTKQSSVEDERVLDEIIAARDRASFQGVDLSQIVLVLQHGLNMVTSVHNANIKGRTPSSVITFRVKFTGNAPGQDIVVFYFDTDVFPRDMSSELAVRSILKIRGMHIDGTSDVSSLWTDQVASVERDYKRPPEATGKRVMTSGETGYGARTSSEKQAQASDLLARRTAAYLRLLSQRRAEAIDREFKAYKRKDKKSLDDFWIAKIKKLDGGEIVSLRSGRVMMIALTSTLSNPVNLNRIRFNSFDVLPTDKAEKSGEHVVLLVDPNICDCYLSDPIESALSKAIQRGSKKEVVVVNRPTVMEELADLSLVLTGSDPSRLERLKVVQFVMVTYTAPVEGWGHPSYRIIEWATKAAPLTIFDPPADFEI